MTSTLKNLLLLLAVITIGYGAYYLYSARSAVTTSNTSEVEFQAMLTRTQAFIARKQELDRMQLDFAVLEDPAFTSLRSYSQPLPAVGIGRDNPFAPANQGI